MSELSLVKRNYISYIDKIVSNHTISHTYLVEIGDYDTDMKYVLDFIKMILCDISYDMLTKSDNSIISLIDNNNYPDIKVIVPDGSTIKKNQLMELQKEYSNKSLLGNKRIYIIQEAEKMNAASANTMLKFLEEPEDDIIAFLLTDNRYHVLDTILSRCQILSLKDTIISFDLSDDNIQLLNCILNPREFFIKYRYFIDNILVDKIVLKEKILEIENYLVYYLNYKNGIHNSIDSNILSAFEKYDESLLLNDLSIIEEELPKLEFNVNYKLWLDSLFSKLVIGG